MKRRLKIFRVIAVIVRNCWVNMLLQVKSSNSLSCLFFTRIIRQKNRAVETCRTTVMLLVIFARVRIPREAFLIFFSTFEVLGLYFFHVLFINFLCVVCLLLFVFVLFVLYFLVVLCFVCVFC